MTDPATDRAIDPATGAAAALHWRDTLARLRADRDRVRRASITGLDGLAVYRHPAFTCALLHRLSHHAHRAGWPRVGRLFWHLNTVLTGADISAPADLGPGLLIQNPIGVSISGRAGRNLTVMACSGLGSELGRREDVGAGPGLPVLGDDVVLEPHSGVMGPVRVGHRTHVGAGLPVTWDLPDDSLVQWPAPRVVSRRAAT